MGEDKPIIGSNNIQEKIAECFSNIQHSIIVINKDIFDEITLMVQSTPVSENIHPDIFDADGNYVSRTERNVEEEDLDYESKAPAGFSDWENKIKRRFERSGIEFDSGDTRNFTDLYYEGKKLPTYNPDFILKKYKKNKRTIILEAHEKLTLLALQQHYAFLQQSGGQYYIFIIVKKEEYKKWQEQNEHKKFCDEVISESKLSNLITELYFMKQRTRKTKPTELSTGKSKVMICINEDCKKEFVEKNFYDKFGEIQEGELHQFCPECRKEFE